MHRQRSHGAIHTLSQCLPGVGDAIPTGDMINRHAARGVEVAAYEYLAAIHHSQGKDVGSAQVIQVLHPEHEAPAPERVVWVVCGSGGREEARRTLLIQRHAPAIHAVAAGGAGREFQRAVWGEQGREVAYLLVCR